jgi:putative endonuclease
MTNKSNTLYTGVSNSIDRRTLEHVMGMSKFTSKYKINKLVFYEEFSDPLDAITNEKRIKGWTRKKKMNLIKTMNPEFNNLLEVSETSSEILRPVASG